MMLRQSGFIVSIDDFGTEYANLALLSNVDFDVLKLDRSWCMMWLTIPGRGP